MRILRKVFAILFALAVFAFGGCAFLQQPKTFSKAGASITLTNFFVEKEYVTMTAYYESPQMIVTLLREDFTMLDGLEDWTLEEYTQTTIDVNKLPSSKVAFSEDGYTYFEYTKEVSGNNYSYFATCHKTDNAFWLIQFGTLSKNYDKLSKTILKYAKTITFDGVQNTPNVNV